MYTGDYRLSISSNKWGYVGMPMSVLKGWKVIFKNELTLYDNKVKNLHFVIYIREWMWSNK